MKRAIAVVMLLTIPLTSAGRADVLPGLIKALENANNRRGASIALVRLGTDAVPMLRQSLASKDPDTRVWSAFTLGEIGSKSAPALAELSKALTVGDKALRAAAAQALGKIGNERAVPALTEVLDDKETEVRRQAIVALGQIGSPAKPAVAQLISALSDHRVRLVARQALIQIGPAATAPLVEAVSTDTIRFDVTIVLREVNSAEVKRLKLETPSADDLQSLSLVLNDTTRMPGERADAAKSLAALEANGYQALIAAFETELIASTAAEAFATADKKAVSLLIEALSHKLADVRTHAANALGEIGQNAGDAVPALIKLLQDEDRNVRYSAVRALHELGPKAGPAVVALSEVILNSREVEATRQWAIKTLVVTLPDTHDDVVKALSEASKEKTNYGVRQLAIQTLRNVDAKAAEEANIK